MSESESKNNSLKDTLIWIAEAVIIFVVTYSVFFLLSRYVIVNCRVSGISMQPTFEDQERVIANRHSKLKRDEVVVLNAPDEPGATYIKRIIGMPGDTITGKNNKIYINGKKINQDFLKPGFKLTDNEDGFSGTKYSYTGNFSIRSLAKTQNYKNIYSAAQLNKMRATNKVPKDTYFVMGDHRSVSKDSRYIGTIPKNKIEGVVKVRYWPLNRLSTF